MSCDVFSSGVICVLSSSSRVISVAQLKSPGTKNVLYTVYSVNKCQIHSTQPVCRLKKVFYGVHTTLLTKVLSNCDSAVVAERSQLPLGELLRAGLLGVRSALRLDLCLLDLCLLLVLVCEPVPAWGCRRLRR